MATTTNNQGDESCTTALERQVQTLTTVVERLTKQNHDLEGIAMPEEHNVEHPRGRPGRNQCRKKELGGVRRQQCPKQTRTTGY